MKWWLVPVVAWGSLAVTFLLALVVGEGWWLVAYPAMAAVWLFNWLLRRRLSRREGGYYAVKSQRWRPRPVGVVVFSVAFAAYALMSALRFSQGDVTTGVGWVLWFPFWTVLVWESLYEYRQRKKAYAAYLAERAELERRGREARERLDDAAWAERRNSGGPFLRGLYLWPPIGGGVPKTEARVDQRSIDDEK